MKTEIWKDIPGYCGLYQVSNFGQVKTLNYHRSGKEQILKQYASSNGYLFVCLCKNGKYKHSLIHRLVAEAFVANPYNLPQVNHKDENKLNNRVDNLEWCTAKYNNNYGTRNERMLEHRTGIRKQRPILCVETGIVYPSLMEASRQTAVKQGNISFCCSGKRNVAGGYHWRYANLK